jgi:hypothetical protein
VTFEEYLVTGPDAEGHAIAGRLAGRMVANRVGEPQGERSDIRQRDKILDENGTAGWLPRRVHGQCLLRRAARDVRYGEMS